MLCSIYKSNGRTKKSRKLASPRLIFPEARPTENRWYLYFIFQTEFPVNPSEGEPLGNNSRQEMFLQPIVKQGPDIPVEHVR